MFWGPVVARMLPEPWFLQCSGDLLVARRLPEPLFLQGFRGVSSPVLRPQAPSCSFLGLPRVLTGRRVLSPKPPHTFNFLIVDWCLVLRGCSHALDAGGVSGLQQKGFYGTRQKFGQMAQRRNSTSRLGFWGRAARDPNAQPDHDPGGPPGHLWAYRSSGVAPSGAVVVLRVRFRVAVGAHVLSILSG